MLVPLMLLVAFGLPIHELVTNAPGAKISTTGPKLDQEAFASAMVVAPTVMTSGTRAGLVPDASAPSFPSSNYDVDSSVDERENPAVEGIRGRATERH